METFSKNGNFPMESFGNFLKLSRPNSEVGSFRSLVQSPQQESIWLTPSSINGGELAPVIGEGVKQDETMCMHYSTGY